MKRKIVVLLALILIAAGVYYWQARPTRLVAQEVSPDQLRQMIQTQDGFFVYFHSPACPNCVKAEPLIAKAVQLSKVNLVQLNVQKYPDAKTEFLVPGIPSVFYYHNHKLGQGITGALAGYQDYMSFFQKAIGS